MAPTGHPRRSQPSRALLPAPLREPYAIYRLVVRIREDLPGSLFSRNHPNLRIELQNRLEIPGPALLIEGRLLGAGADTSSAEWEAELRGYPTVVDIDIRPEGRGAAHFRYTEVTPPMHEVTRRQRLLTRYPIVVQDGWMRFETVSTAGRIRAAVADFRRSVGPTHVEAVRRGPITLGSLGLGQAQETVFRAAMTSGYFDLPRGISVTGLAGELGLSKSAVSETLTRIEKRLAEAALQLSLV